VFFNINQFWQDKNSSVSKNNLLIVSLVKLFVSISVSTLVTN